MHIWFRSVLYSQDHDILVIHYTILIDFELERRRLWDEALPELQQHFLAYGLDIVLVDMHQGSEVDLTYDRQSFDRLLDDVEKSSTSEIGPFFLVRMTMVTKIITTLRKITTT